MSLIDESTVPKSAVSAPVSAWKTRARSIQSALSLSAGVEWAGSICLIPRLLLGSGWTRQRGSSRALRVTMFDSPVLTLSGAGCAATARVLGGGPLVDCEQDTE